MLIRSSQADDKAVVIAPLLILGQLIAQQLLKKNILPIALILISALAGALIY